MLSAGIISIGGAFLESVEVSQESILSPFLFNVYLNELDVFINKLAKEHDKKYNLKKRSSSEAMRRYKAIMYKFSTKKVGDALAEYGSPEELRKVLRDLKKEHLKQYGRTRGVDLEVRYIQYVRYAGDFLLGIVGPRKFAMEIRSKIDLFLKSNLHLKIKKNTIVNRNEKSVLFLGFAIYFPTFNKKIRTKWSHLRSVAKYKKRVLARLRLGDARLARAGVAAIKCDLLRVFRLRLKKLQLSWNSNSREFVSKSLIAEWLNKEVNCTKGQLLKKDNEALIR